MRTTKRSQSIEIGNKDREIVATAINNYLLKESPKESYKLTRLHEFMTIMTENKRMVSNLFLNRFQNLSVDDNLGLDYVFKNEHNKAILIGIRFFDDPDIFIKKPTDSDLNEFVSKIKHNYFFLFTRRPRKKENYTILHYEIMQLQYILDDLKFTPYLRTSKGNKNRIIFQKRNMVLTPKKLMIHSVNGEVYDFFSKKEETLFEKLQNLLK